MEAIDQYSFLQWLVKIALDSLVEHPLLDAIIRISSDENGRYLLPCSDQVPVQLNPGHFRHVNVGDQAVGRRASGGRKEFCCRRKYHAAIAQRLDQSSHGVAKSLVVIDDRDQGLLGQHASAGIVVQCFVRQE